MISTRPPNLGFNMNHNKNETNQTYYMIYNDKNINNKTKIIIISDTNNRRFFPNTFNTAIMPADVKRAEFENQIKQNRLFYVSSMITLNIIILLRED